MKLIIYKDQKKITVDNITIPDEAELENLIEETHDQEITLKELQLYNLQVIATRSIMSEEDTDTEEIKPEMESGINWYQETVN
jgi:hypothetical protein